MNIHAVIINFKVVIHSQRPAQVDLTTLLRITLTDTMITSELLEFSVLIFISHTITINPTVTGMENMGAIGFGD